MGYRIGIDIGGTFTDFALMKGDDLVLHKNLSTPEDRSLGVIQGLERLADIEGVSLAELLGEVDAIVHGTTVADNTLIEMNGATTGLLTTEGFRDELELRRGYKEDIWDVRLTPPKPIVPRRRRDRQRRLRRREGRERTALRRHGRHQLRRLGRARRRSARRARLELAPPLPDRPAHGTLHQDRHA